MLKSRMLARVAYAAIVVDADVVLQARAPTVACGSSSLNSLSGRPGQSRHRVRVSSMWTWQWGPKLALSDLPSIRNGFA